MVQVNLSWQEQTQICLLRNEVGHWDNSHAICQQQTAAVRTSLGLITSITFTVSDLDVGIYNTLG